MKRFSWGQGIAAAILLFIVAVIAFAVFAMRRPSDLVAPDYYHQGTEYQDRIDRVRRTQALNARGMIQLDGHTLRLHLPHATATGVIRLYRPSSKSMDREFPIQLDESGVQVVDLTGFASGLWRANVEWDADGQGYYAEVDGVLP